MPLKVKNIEKLYYTIGEVAEKFAVNTSLIRFWEKEFPAINPKKNKKGNRLFTASDVEIIGKIYQLVKIEGFTLEGARLKLKENDAPNISVEHVNIYSKLVSIRQQLLDLSNQL